VVPLRTDKGTAKPVGGGMPLEGLNAAELTEGIIGEVVGRNGIEPPTPGFSVDPGRPDYETPSTDIVDNQADSES